MRAPEKPSVNTYIHPAWRGIGCILLAIIPFAAWEVGGMMLQIARARGIPLSPELNNALYIPAMKIGDTELFPAASLPYAQILFALTTSVLLFAALTIVYSIIYRASGGGRGNPLDLPMPKKRRRRR
ncbi:MAG: hypothetical protein Fur0018_27660 [Anaerolineales bacterium]